MKEIIWTLLFLLSMVLAFLIPNWIDTILEKRRRKHYPGYFELYDAGLRLCFEASSKANHEADFFKHKLELLTEGLREGECTEEYFKERFEYLANRHIEATRAFKAAQEEAEKLFRKADFYAKENNLRWGVIY